MPRQKRLLEALSDAEAPRLLAAVCNAACKSCLCLIYAFGLRVGEASRLESRAIDGTRRLLRIVGKGDKERLVPVPMAVLENRRWLWRQHRHHVWMFPNRTGGPPSAQACCSTAAPPQREKQASPNVSAYLISDVTAMPRGFWKMGARSGPSSCISAPRMIWAQITTTSLYRHLSEPARVSPAAA